jgi:nucleoside-diphosphate-sugar epimerase
MSLIRKDVSSMASCIDPDFFHSKSILITGASGLVGTYLLEYFQQLQKNKDCDLRLYASSLTGEFVIPLSEGTQILKGDISEGDFIGNMPTFDIVIHAAGYAQPGKFLINPLKTLKINSDSTARLIEKVRPGGRFLFISSSELYSGLQNPPFTEEQIGSTNTTHPRAAYIEGKRAGETIVSIANKAGVAMASSVRLSLAYGPGTKVDDSRVMSHFINQSLSESKIILRDAGTSWRTYGYITDLVELCLKILSNGTEDVYNVGGVSRIQILDLAKLIARKTQSTVIPNNSSNSYLAGAPEDVWLSLDKVLRLSEKVNFVELEEGLDRTIEWQRKQLGSLGLT